MSQELHYTSVPRGLLPGTRGFCTVASTPNMSGPLRERLEGLSGYQQVFPPHDPKAALTQLIGGLRDVAQPSRVAQAEFAADRLCCVGPCGPARHGPSAGGSTRPAAAVAGPVERSAP